MQSVKNVVFDLFKISVKGGCSIMHSLRTINVQPYDVLFNPNLNPSSSSWDKIYRTQHKRRFVICCCWFQPLLICPSANICTRVASHSKTVFVESVVRVRLVCQVAASIQHTFPSYSVWSEFVWQSGPEVQATKECRHSCMKQFDPQFVSNHPVTKV